MDSFNSFVYVFDRREEGKSGPEQVYIDDSYSFPDLKKDIIEKFSITDENFVICTTGRTELKDENFEKLVQSGDSVYLLNSIDQPLETSVTERIEFQPHYDTLIKSGMYEYYASEGHVNPLPFAFAELIDNALAATTENKERIIELSIHFDETGNNHCVCVYDNGKGMSSRQLNNWAIYRLSKFNRQERDSYSTTKVDRTKLRSEGGGDKLASVPKSLNSDISWFGVGGKQAVFFIGSSTRVITKTQHSCDVHEFTMSMADFKRKEMKKEAIFSGYIRNRKTGDTSHVESWERFTKDFINIERSDESFTRIVVTDIKPEHISFMKNGFEGWTKQLAHIYHYYIHGPEGNTVMSRERKNVGAVDVQINVSLFEGGTLKKKAELAKCDDDLQSRYIRSSMDNFEFVYLAPDKSMCEGVIRYHPFLYDRETNPSLSTEASENEDSDAPLVRNTRSAIECFWNGRLIPYTFIDGFEWCKPTKKVMNFPMECYMRVSGCLFTNDKFQVSTNKLTFIDLDARLRDPKGMFYHTIMGHPQRKQSITRSFQDWLRDCHEKYDKQIKFLGYEKTKTRKEHGGKKSGNLWSVYNQIEWDGRIFKKGEMIRTQRTNPIITGSIKSFLLFGDYKGAVFAVGGEVEIIQEPAKIYGGVKSYPIGKIDRSVSPADVKQLVVEEESRLPSRIRVEWPEGNVITNGYVSTTKVAIGTMKISIINRRNESIMKLPAAAGTGSKRKLMMRQQVLYVDPRTKKKESIASHTTSHGKSWPYWFRRIDAAREPGNYEIHLQVILAETNSEFLQNEKLPSQVIKFSIEHSCSPTKFVIGVLSSTLKVGVPFDIPITFQNEQGMTSKVPTGPKLKPTLSAKGLKLKYNRVKVEGNQLMLKDVVAEGDISNLQGKDFKVKVIIADMQEDTQVLRFRMFPGYPYRVSLIEFNGEEFDRKAKETKVLRVENGAEMNLTVACLDLCGNITFDEKLVAVCKMTGIPGLPSLSCDLSQSGRGVLSSRLQHKNKKSSKHKKDDKHQTFTIKGVVKVHDRKTVTPLELDIILEPSTQIQSMELFYLDHYHNGKVTKIKKGQDIYCEAGSMLKNLTFVIYDEAKRPVVVDPTCASRLKVNWVGEKATDKFEKGQLPDCPVPNMITETKFCQVTLSGNNRSISIPFHVRPVAGCASTMRITHNLKEVRLGVPTLHPVHVNLADKYGNSIDVGPGYIPYLKISGELLDDSQVSMDIKDSHIAISNLQFNEGPPTSRKLTVNYKDEIIESFVLQLSAGTPVSLKVEGYSEDTNFLEILSGCRMNEPIKVQLYDGWGNPSNVKGVHISLGKDPGIKLSPASNGVKTNADGSATFPLFTVTAKCGIYNVNPRAVYDRSTIEGPKLAFSVLPNNNTPVKIEVVNQMESISLHAGEGTIPDYTVNILSEEGERVTSSVHVCMVSWRGKSQKDIPSNAEWIRQVSSDGKVVFEGGETPTTSGDYYVTFVVVETKSSKNPTLMSDRISMLVKPGPPSSLVPLADPGTKTVSNTRDIANRTIISSLQLRLKDWHGNNTNFTREDGTARSSHIEVSIQHSGDTYGQLPKFEGNTAVLRLPINVEGAVTIQNVVLSENSPGTDGGAYFMVCGISSSETSNDIKPYKLKFFFYNDTDKQSKIAEMLARRSELQKNIKDYQEIIDMSENMMGMLNKEINEFRRKKSMVINQLDLRFAPDHDKAESMLEDINRKINSFNTSSLRRCKVKNYANESEGIIGKVCHLATIKDPRVARLISWHLSGDMDCIITKKTEKAEELNRKFRGNQQVWPLDTMKKKSSDWKRPLSVTSEGNPRYAIDLMVLEPKYQNDAKTVFSLLLGDTMIMDTISSANKYRKHIIKHSSCPNILTLDGAKIRSSGKFGGKQNTCPDMERLSAVFGEPLPSDIAQAQNQKNLLNELISVLKSEESAVNELKDARNADKTPRDKKEKADCQRQLDKLEAEIKEAQQRIKHPGFSNGPSTTHSNSSGGAKRHSNGPIDDLTNSPRKKKRRGG